PLASTPATARSTPSLHDALPISAVDSRRNALAHAAGRRIVDLVRDDVKISQILTREAFENAIRVNGALGGSTNAVIHLLAFAGRDRKSTRLNSSHVKISYAVFCL